MNVYQHMFNVYNAGKSYKEKDKCYKKREKGGEFKNLKLILY